VPGTATADEPEVILHKIEIVNVGVTAPRVGSVYIPNIESEDFDKSAAARTGPDIAVGIAKLVSDRVLANMKTQIGEMLEIAKKEGLAMAKAGLEKAKVGIGEAARELEGHLIPLAAEKLEKATEAAKELMEGEKATELKSMVAATLGRASERLEEAAEDAKARAREVVEDHRRV